MRWRDDDTADRDWCAGRAAQYRPPGPPALLPAGGQHECGATLPAGDGLGPQPVRCAGCGDMVLIRP